MKRYEGLAGVCVVCLWGWLLFGGHRACVVVTRRTAGKIVVALLLWIVALVIVVTGELLPEHSAPMEFIAAAELSDKLLHFGAYTVLAFIPTLGFSLPVGLSLAALMVVLGVGLEFAQRFVPGRSFEVADMVANACGVLVGVALALAVRKVRAARRGQLKPMSRG